MSKFKVVAPAVAAMGLMLAGSVAHAQYSGSNLTGTTGLIAIDKVGDKIRFYDPKTMTQIKVLDPPGKSVHELTVSYDHKTAYSPLYGDGVYGHNPTPNNKVLVIDLPTMAITKVITTPVIAPHGMVATRDGKIWVTADLPRKLMLINPVSGQVEAIYDTPSKGPHFLAMLPDESKIYISNKEGPISVFDVKKRVFLPSIPIGRPGVESGNGSGSEGLTPTHDGKRLLIVDNDTNAIHVIDTTTDREIDKVPLSGGQLTNPKRSRLVRIQVSPDGNYVVASSSAGGVAWIIDAHDLRKQTPVLVAKGPQGIAFPPDGKSVIVSSHDSGLLTRINLATKKQVAAYDGGDGIEVLAYY